MTNTVRTENENDTRARSIYATGWAVHQLLQLYQQAFLFDCIMIHRLVHLTVVMVALFPREKTVFLIALILRNVARLRRCPFLWDSEFWLALTDLTVIVQSLLPATKSSSIDSKHSGTGGGVFIKGALPCMRIQLAIQYAACALFKLNSAFLSRHTSCAPIFVLSLLVKVWPESITGTPNWILTLMAQMAPWSVVIVEALIAIFLFPNGRVHDIGIGLALVFHALIAITPRPNGVPTFSCVAVSRLFLLIGEDSSCSDDRTWVPPAVQIFQDGCIGRTIFLCVAVMAVVIPLTNDPAIVLYLVWSCLCVLALLESNTSQHKQRYSIVVNNQDKTRTTNLPAEFHWRRRLLVGLAVFYALFPPILGIQEIGSNTMFASLRTHGGTNHVWGFPTGLLQRWWYSSETDDTDGRDPHHSWWFDVFGGGVVRVEYTNSLHLNQLYPGEMTDWLSSDLRTLLTSIGHVSRQFNPKARRVLGPAARQGMPHWKPPSNATTFNDDPGQFVKYTVPAFEFRRLLYEARIHARETNQSFEIEYTRLIGATGNEDWRRRSKGMLVRLKNDTGDGSFDCLYRDERIKEIDWEPCPITELALLPPLPFWATKVMLFYPYAIFSEKEYGRDYFVDELLCNY
jgi:hypothetical protein